MGNPRSWKFDIAIKITFRSLSLFLIDHREKCFFVFFIETCIVAVEPLSENGIPGAEKGVHATPIEGVNSSLATTNLPPLVLDEAEENEDRIPEDILRKLGKILMIFIQYRGEGWFFF